MTFRPFGQPQPLLVLAFFSLIVVAVCAALTPGESKATPAATEITSEEAETLVRSVKVVAHEFRTKYNHGLAPDPPVATNQCPYYLFRAWVDWPDSASTLVGWYRVNKRNADVWADPPFDEQPVVEPALAEAQARLRLKHHISEDMVRRLRSLPSWGDDCIKATEPSSRR